MFTIGQLLRYFQYCTNHVELKDRRKIFEELATQLEYWGRMSKVTIENEFKKSGIL